MNYCYAPLYKRTATGAIQTWWMEQEGAKYRTHSGQDGGAITVTAWTAAKPKNVGRSNETTGQQQASAEVDSAYDLKRKKGYRETVDAAETSTRFQCMLADKYIDRQAKLYINSHVRGLPLWVQPKLDGIRCIANEHGLWSRAGARITAVPHIEEKLAPIFARFPELILDGELYNHTLKADFNSIVSLVKKTKSTPEDLLLSAELIQYWVYDCLPSNHGARFSQRLQYIGDLHTGAFVAVPSFMATTEAEVDALYESFLAEGYEGAMVRVDAPYEQKRSQTLLKRKEKMDAEFEVIRFEEGQGNAAGMAKIAYCKILINGVMDEFKADIVGTREQLRQWFEMRDTVVGKQATIEFQNYTPGGKPRFGKLKIMHHTERW